VVRIAELLTPEPAPVWTLVRQCGVEDVVTLLSGAEQEQRWLRGAGDPPPAPIDPANPPWGLAALSQLQDRYLDHGLRLAAIEDTAPMDDVRLGGPRRDEQISHVIEQINAMGQLGIEVLCYNWMAITSWARTVVDVPLRGGALSTGYRHADAEALGALLPEGAISEEQLWANLKYFLDAVIPVAETAGVRLGCHPDDPPRPTVRGVPRIVRSVEALHRIVDLHPSRANGITLCQGNVSLMTNELPAVIRELGRRDCVVFVHFRDVRGDVDEFIETFHDEGQNDLAECMRAWVEVGFHGPMRPDHVPTLYGESNDRPGYATLGRLFAIGYLRGLLDAARSR